MCSLRGFLRGYGRVSCGEAMGGIGVNRIVAGIDWTNEEFGVIADGE